MPASDRRKLRHRRNQGTDPGAPGRANQLTAQRTRDRPMTRNRSGAFVVIVTLAIQSSFVLGLWSSVIAAESNSFVPDPQVVQRYGPAWKYPQAGWLVLHIEGTPYERGFQHGRLLAR